MASLPSIPFILFSLLVFLHNFFVINTLFSLFFHLSYPIITKNCARAIHKAKIARHFWWAKSRGLSRPKNNNGQLTQRQHTHKKKKDLKICQRGEGRTQKWGKMECVGDSTRHPAIFQGQLITNTTTNNRPLMETHSFFFILILFFSYIYL
jgi:hypothetical protein